MEQFQYLWFLLYHPRELEPFSLNQSDTDLRSIVTWFPAFSRAFGSFLILTLSSHWLIAIFNFALIGTPLKTA